MEIIRKEVHLPLVKAERAEAIVAQAQASSPSSITVDVSMSRTV